MNSQITKTNFTSFPVTQLKIIANKLISSSNAVHGDHLTPLPLITLQATYTVQYMVFVTTQNPNRPFRPILSQASTPKT